MKSKQILVSGRVQGVGFRNYAKKAAITLGITGWARNLLTSEVEILAQYKDESALEKFITELRKGPMLSKVTNIEIIDVDSESVSCHTFTIEPDGERKRVY